MVNLSSMARYTVEETKNCTKCNLLKPVSYFSKDSGNKNGLYSWCKSCVRIHHMKHTDRMQRKGKVWKENNRLKVREYQKNYDVENRQKKLLLRKIRREKFPEYYKDKALKRTHNITIEEYKKLLITQNYVCAICNQPEKLNRDLAVDHDHVTGEIRGLLCLSCNTGIGNFKDNITVLNKAINYLENNNAFIR